MKKTLIPIALAFALIALSPAAFAAGTATGTLTVNASVAAKCTIGGGTMNFGAYDPVVTNLTAPLDGSATMTLACTKGFIPTITIPTTGRTITGSGSTLTYDLYKDSGYSTVWGDTGGAIFTPATAPGKAGAPVTIYGRIPGGQDPGVAALLTGTIVVTVIF